MNVPTTATQEDVSVTEWFERFIGQCYMLAFLNGKEYFGNTEGNGGEVHWFIARRGEVIMAQEDSTGEVVWAFIVEAKPRIVMEAYYNLPEVQ